MVWIAVSVVLYKACLNTLAKQLRAWQAQTAWQTGSVTRLTLAVLDNDNGQQLEAVQALLKQTFEEEFAGGLPLKVDFLTLQAPNVGFGGGHNRVFDELALQNKAVPDAFLMINPDGLPLPGLLEGFIKTQAQLEESGFRTGLLEAKQLPLEHPKVYHSQTGETNWCSGACLWVSGPVFKALNGFDERFFMYMEDVDLSWRARLAGYSCHVAPQALFYHESASQARSSRQLMLDKAALVLAHKYNHQPWVQKGKRTLAKTIGNTAFQAFWQGVEAHSPVAKEVEQNPLFKTVVNFNHKQFFAPLRWQPKQLAKLEAAAGCQPQEPRPFSLTEAPLVSVIVRTLPGREALLNRCLTALYADPYPNKQVVVVCQGTPQNPVTPEGRKLHQQQNGWLAESTPNHHFEHLWRYNPEDSFVLADERAKNLNLGLEAATGTYVAFLDDDDLWLTEHLSLLIGQLEENPQHAWAYGLCCLDYEEGPPEAGYLVRKALPFHHKAFSLAKLWDENYLPIHSFILHRNRLKSPELLSFDESLCRREDYLFLLKLSLYHPPLRVGQTTSLYKVSLQGHNSTAFEEKKPKTQAAKQALEEKQRPWQEARAYVEAKKPELLQPFYFLSYQPKGRRLTFSQPWAEDEGFFTSKLNQLAVRLKARLPFGWQVRLYLNKP